MRNIVDGTIIERLITPVICYPSPPDSKVRHVVSTLVTRNLETLDHSSDSLLLKRSKEVSTFPERWALVSGSVEPGETFAQAAIRELEEETR